MVEISLSGSGEGPGGASSRGYSTSGEAGGGAVGQGVRRVGRRADEGGHGGVLVRISVRLEVAPLLSD